MPFDPRLHRARGFTGPEPSPGPSLHRDCVAKRPGWQGRGQPRGLREPGDGCGLQQKLMSDCNHLAGGGTEGLATFDRSFDVAMAISADSIVFGRRLSLASFRPSRRPAVSRHLSAELAFALTFGAVVFALVLWFPGVLRDADTLWHITTGEWILAHRAVPVVDTFSYTRVGQTWAPQEWLSEVILALAYRAAGWNGLLMLTAAAAGSTVGIVALYIRRRVRFDVAAMLVLLMVACGGPSLLTRPHLIALPVLAYWTARLVSARERGVAPSLWLLPLMTVWANLHGGFVFGLALTAALAVEAAFDPACRGGDMFLSWGRSWGVFILGAVVAACANPRGIDGLLFPVRLMSMTHLDQIQEWQPSDLGHLGGMTVSILVAFYVGLTGSLRLPRFRVLLVAGLVFVTMQHMRYGQLTGVVAPLLIAQALGPAGPSVFPERMLCRIAGLIAAIALCCRIGLPLHRIDEGSYAPTALSRVPQDLRGRPVLNDYGFGGLLIFSGVKPFIDGRADLYGDDFLGMYISLVYAQRDVLDAVLCRYGIAWTMLPPGGIVTALMDRTPGWRRLYSDGFAVIHVRESGGGTPVCPGLARD